MGNYRVFVEKYPEFQVEAKSLMNELNENLQLSLGSLRYLNVYDLFGFTPELLEKSRYGVFGEIMTDRVTDECDLSGTKYLAVEYLPGQFDQRAASAVDCVRLIDPKADVRIKSSRLLIFDKNVSDGDLEKIRHYYINAVESRQKDLSVLSDTEQAPVKPVKPVFVNYSEDMSRFEARPGVEVLYKQNEMNDLFTLIYVFNTGTENDPALSLASDYVSYLGTSTMSAEDIASRMYEIACSFGIYPGANKTSIQISGLSENMAEAMDIVDGLISGAQPDEAILANLKADLFRSRENAKLSQGSCFGALQRYMVYGPDFISRSVLDNKAVENLTSDELLAKVRGLMGYAHEVLYYGPQGEKELLASLDSHHKTSPELQPLERQHVKTLEVKDNNVVLAQYDAKQLYMMQYSNRGEKSDIPAEPGITLYNEYFGGGMNSIVFQEMREARGLAYTAMAQLASPYYPDESYYYLAFIATQNDKMKQAIEAFDDIINDMPESQAAFDIAKEALINRLRTKRIVRDQILWQYISDRELGLEEPLDRQIFEAVQDMTLEDVKAVQEKWVKGRSYTFGILGDKNDIDLKYLRSLGPVKEVSLEEIFGY